MKKHEKQLNKNLILIGGTILLLVISYCLLVPILSSAQTPPQFLISWKAYNYAPSWYQGKNFPIYSTPVEISFELLENDKIVNLSKHEIRWYINDSLFTKGKGLQTIGFVPKNRAGTKIVIRIAIVAYRGEELNKFIYIPVKSPEVIISSPYLRNVAEIGETYRFKALPFFFNANSVNSLAFRWMVNSQPVFSEKNQDPDILNLSISTSTPTGMQIELNAMVSNVLETVESATKNLKLIIQ